ncbi:MAG: HIRAN domain-containing protein [Oscillospiraceae bacterium]|nr:HIRAN domain-containing protein [Oscillospiraceae bacterium]
MGELAKTQSGALVEALHREEALPKPYGAEILLLQTMIAGTTHVVGIQELEPFLQPGDRLELIRIPSNPSDPWAIKIYNRDRVKLGYVPQKENQILARLMDAGKLLYAVLRAKAWKGSWLQLWIDIYMTED